MDDFGDEALMDIPGFGALDGFLRSPLDMVVQDLGVSCAPSEALMQSVPSLDSAASSSGKLDTTVLQQPALHSQQLHDWRWQASSVCANNTTHRAQQ